MRAPALLLAVLLLAVCLHPAATAHGGDAPTLERLLGNLLRASSDRQVDQALDDLAVRIGQVPGFADEAAFADWLGAIAEARARHPRVLLRRGWAYVTAGRGRAALEPLDLARADREAEPVALAYLGEAWRQAGEPAQALTFLKRAVEAGYGQTTYLDEAALKAGFDLRSGASSRDAAGLPAYAQPLAEYLNVRPAAALHAALARWILDDHGAYARDGERRSRQWSTFGAQHALATVRLDPGVERGARLCLDAATALRSDHPSIQERPLYADCLAQAYRLGRGPDPDRHELPQAIAYLAQAALEEGRFELAGRLARERLRVSDSPLAREVLRALPVDLGE